MTRFTHLLILSILLVFNTTLLSQNERDEYQKHLSILDSLILSKHFDQAIEYTHEQPITSENIRALFVHQRNRALLRQRLSPPQIGIECLDMHNRLRDREDSLGIYLNARILELLGHYNYRQGNLYIGLTYLDSASQQFALVNDYSATIYNLNMIGTIYDHIGEKANTVRYYQRALKVFEEHPIDSSYYFDLLVDLGNLHFSLNQIDRAESFYRAVYENPTLFKYPETAADIFTNLGNVALEKNEIDEAEYFYQQGLRAFENLKDSNMMALVLHNIASLKEDTNLDEAFDFYQQSLDIKTNHADYDGMANTLYSIARLYFLNDDIQKAEETAKDALVASKMSGVNESLSNIYKLLGSIYAKQNLWESAYNYNRLYRTISDSVQLFEEQDMINKIEQVYQIEEQQQIITDLEKSESQKQAQLKKSKVINYALGGATILLIIVLILLMSSFQQMQRAKTTLFSKNLEITAAEALVKGQEEERQRLAHELHDKVGNHITVLKNYVMTHSGSDVNLLKMVKDMSAEVRNISQDLMPPVLERFGLADALEELCTRYRDQSDATIDLNIDQSERMPIERDEQINLYRLIQELIQISLFHYKANYLLIDMRWNEVGVWVNIEDNGVKKQRYSEDDRIIQPWQPIEHRVQFLKGEFKRSSHNQGNEYHIYIPNKEI